MGKPISWLIGAVGVLITWLVCQMLADLIGEVIWATTAPARRPIWRMFVAANWPWPLLLMLAVGLAAMLIGVLVMGDTSRERLWGVWLFLGGAAVALIAPFLWRDARRERARRW